MIVFRLCRKSPSESSLSMFDMVKLDWTRRNLPCSLAKASGYGQWSRTFSTEPRV